jgi:hypothetical protein
MPVRNHRLIKRGKTGKRSNKYKHRPGWRATRQTENHEKDAENFVNTPA